MKIILGSTSEDKKVILEKALAILGEKLEIEGVEVLSEITDQPLDEETTIKGAINRAKNVAKIKQGADLYVGLEGGLHEVGERGYFLVCVAALGNASGKVCLGISSKLRVPQEVSQRIKKGDSFGMVVREYKEKHKGDTRIQLLTNDLISREKAFVEAIRNALLEYQNLIHY